MFFRDGERRIDFVLAYHDTEKTEKIRKREIFEKNLQDEGLELELEDKKVRDDAPWARASMFGGWGMGKKLK